MNDKIANLAAMSATGKRHMESILSDVATKTTVIGLRKILNAQWRKDRDYSVSRTTAKVAAWEVAELEEALARCEPQVTRELHDSGVKILNSKRYAKRLRPVQHVIDNLDCFRLIGFQEAGEYRGNHVPVYRAVARGGDSFTFINVPWQSGGDGPEIL